jgi:tRNA (cmo5U34)-methyltransferase
VEWQAEPNSVGFYEKVGGRYLRYGEPTSWARVLPIVGLDLERQMSEWRWDPETYLESIHAAVPGFDELEERVAAATAGEASRLLELGIGTGETARRVLALHPGAQLTAIDSSPEMLARAKELLPGADLRLARLEDPLPSGPFDLVYSTLAVHHLDAAGKRDLFERLGSTVRPGGRFVLADVVVPADPADQQIEIDWVMDLPDTLDDQLRWLREAGFDAAPTWAWKDLAVVTAVRPG